MTPEERHQENEAAYRRLKPTIDQSYPPGRFVAIDGGQIVADAATLDELLAALTALGKDPKEGLAVQAGVEYPEFAWILLPGESA
jgi:hypothetical protein